jgi:heat shock protein HslJ
MRAALITCLFVLGIESGPALAAQSPVLEGSPWKMVSYLDNKGRTVTALPKIEVTAAFQSGRIAGRDGCNQYGAAYNVSGSVLTIKLGMSTMMACEPMIMDQAQAYLSAMSSSATYQITDKQLQIIKGNGQIAVTFAMLDPTPLAGARWKATMYNNGRGGAQSLAAGTEITAVFGTNGTLSGLASCNQYSATYEAATNTLKINGAIATTRMMCSEPAMQQEAAYLAALAKATAYRIESNRLELRDAKGALQASYVAQP